jgi:hypothetical protein
VDEFVEVVAKPSAKVLDVEASFCATLEIVGPHVQTEARLKLILPSDYVSLAAFNGLAAAGALVDDDLLLGHRHHPFTCRNTARASLLTDRIADGVEWLPERLPDSHQSAPTRDGAVHISADFKAVWFKDPDGNILNLVNETMVGRGNPVGD